MGNPSYMYICTTELLTCVDVGVLLHVALLVEPLAAVVAGIRPRVAVDEQVGGQGAGALKALAALLALEHFLHVVHRPEMIRRDGFWFWGISGVPVTSVGRN